MLLPYTLEQFQSRFPQVHLRVIEGLFPELSTSILDGTLDFFVGPVVEPALSRELTAERLLKNDVVILARKGHPLQSARSLSALAGASWIGFQVTDPPELAPDQYFRRLGLAPPHIGIEVSSGLSALMVAAHSDFLAILPEQYMQYPGASDLLARIEIPERLAAPPIYLVSRSNFPLTPAAQFLVGLIRNASTAQPGDSE
jgi:LysR family transcriptional regulator, regulator of abg operon